MKTTHKAKQPPANDSTNIQWICGVCNHLYFRLWLNGEVQCAECETPSATLRVFEP